MTEVAWLLVTVVVVAGVLGCWLLWTAGRLDRQHLRLEAARASLDAQLARRSSAAAALASADVLEPASALLLLDAAVRARSEDGDERWQAESDLTDVLLRVDLPEPGSSALVADVDDAARRAGLARRIHNDLVAGTVGLHGRRRVRWFRLAGRAQPPVPVEYDDRPRNQPA